ncbi:MAG: DUF5074 domain-containing protein [Flavobacteriales bacterium]|nr:DUF5074 domain-containing protein [Flavobacteriales bacterium]
MKKILLWTVLMLTFVSCSKNTTPVAPIIIDSTPETVETGVNKAVTLSTEVIADESVTSYVWLLGQEILSNAKTLVFSPTQAGEYEIIFKAINAGGFDQKKYTVKAKLYPEGYFVLNEGWYGHESGSVDYFDASLNRTQGIYALANPNMTIGNTSCSLVKADGYFYAVSKQGRRLVKYSAMDFKDKGEISDAPDGRSFAAIDANTGVYTTANGVFIVNLNSMKVVSTLKGENDAVLTGEYGDVTIFKDYILVVKTSGAVLAFKKSDYSYVKNVCAAKSGFAQTKDGVVVAADGAKIFQIESTLNVIESTLPTGVAVYRNSMSWTPSSLKAVPGEDAFYFANGSGWSMDNIYKYNFIKGGVAITAPAGKYLYGAFGVAKNGDIIATFCGASWGDNNNTIKVFDKNGTEKASADYSGYMFPEMVLVNE